MAVNATSGVQQAYDRPIINNITISKYLDPSKRINITQQVLVIDIYESIQHSTVFCDIGIDDGIGFTQDSSTNESSLGDVIGEEIITIDFQTVGKEESIQYTFFVNSVKKAVPSNQSTSITLYLKCVSLDFIKSFNMWVWKGYNDSYDNMVKDILTNQLQTEISTNNIEETKGVHKIVVPKLNAFNAIDFLRARAVATNYESSPFLFFQNKRGYNFRSLASLLLSRQQSVPKYVYGDMSSKRDGVADKFFSIISINNDKRFDLINKVKDGVYNNIVQQFDLITKKLEITQYKITDHDDKFNFKNTKSFNTDRFLQDFSEGKGTSYFYVVDSDRPETFLSETLGPKTAYTYLMGQNMVSVELYGNSDLTVGDMIELDVDKSVSTSDERVKDKFLSGFFLIVNLRHQIVFDTSGPHYTTYCTLAKGDTTNEEAV